MVISNNPTLDGFTFPGCERYNSCGNVRFLGKRTILLFQYELSHIPNAQEGKDWKVSYSKVSKEKEGFKPCPVVAKVVKKVIKMCSV